MRLRQSRLAQADLAEILRSSADDFGVEQALTYRELFERRYRQLLDFPESGPADPTLQTDIRSIACGSHRIYYRIEGDTITIRRILHKSRDVKARLG